MCVYSVGVFDRFWLLILPPKNTWVGFFIFNSQFPKFSIPILLFSQECVVHLESGPELSSSSLPSSSQFSSASVQSKDTVTTQVIDPSSMSSPLQVLPVPGGRRLTLAPPSPHHGGGGGGGGGEDGSEGKREGRRESTLSFSLAVPTGPHHHPRRRESIAPCREACALMRYRFPAKLKSKT